MDFRRSLLRQGDFELLDEKQEVFFGLGVTGEDDFAAVCCGEVDVEHLHGSELFEHGSGS